ncbi:hypothetical protein [Bartonella schoenbuchensis]|uniref:Uncharacterized protein n=3 Tax=Bartonella schoenbuchensis TaxID=165694 RepID=E6Z0L7_BARSR|nr:hypothetical protein [Bartonella schoenbuchensis]AQX31546.1 hypothetical protein BscR1v2_016430 [Bartonella schoenbuchensis R1]ENN90475.1 hypothetical protein m07a_pML00670 [Bartonella schoenbuchensis m07a]CBI82655.1 conserved hypothetical protein [Bartonella schoenbuchensis R1]CDP79686.1 hypothetical protein BN1046_00583 [Bartonella schoenbuchensis]
MKKKLPKSYMTDEQREKLRTGGLSQNSIYIAESDAADRANDGQTAWEWLAMTELPAHSLLCLRKWNGPQFIRDMGFSTKNADEEYGPDWLDKGVVIGGHHF